MHRFSAFLVGLTAATCAAGDSDPERSGPTGPSLAQGADADPEAGDADLGGGGDSAPAVASCPGEAPVSDPCIAVDCGNEEDVGKPCTDGGGECAGTGAPFCTVEQADTHLAFCTNFCFGDDECGSNATCVVNPENQFERGCVPDACL